MTHLSIHEWGKVQVHNDPDQARDDQFSRAQANALIAAAKAHRFGGDEGTGIVSDHHTFLKARQMVGILAAPGCSLEILPKVDPDAPNEDDATVRARLIHMLDVALDLKLSEGGAATMARQSETLLDILIRLFADRLLAETRRGLPRRYIACEEDLPTLRGRLDVVRQFTVNAVRPDRLACRYDTLSSDIPLLQVMKAAIVFLVGHARDFDTRRKLEELRFVLADVADMPRSALPWDRIRIDRSNRRWEVLLTLAKMFLKRDWQATHHDRKRDEGVTLLFAMNDLFEAYVAALLRRELAPLGFEVKAQGGLRYCLGEWKWDDTFKANRFQTKPDIQILRPGKKNPVAIIDTKWKQLAVDPLDAKTGISQGDVYQMMAYARLYDCKRLMLLYPDAPGASSTSPRLLGIGEGTEMLAVGRIDVAAKAELSGRLRGLAMGLAQSS